MRKIENNRKNVIFQKDSSDSEDLGMKTNNEYAKNYDNWRKKEELNKLKTKYGDLSEHHDSGQDSETSSSDDDDEAAEITQDTEKSFFKTLSCLKNKDQSIYDNEITFFNEGKKVIQKSKTKKKHDAPVTIKDYERKLLLDENALNENETNSPTNEEPASNMSLSAFANDDSDESGDELFKIRKTTKEDEQEEESDYRKWLAGQVDETKDTEAESDLKPLKDYWSDPKLDADEKFLRDYILNKRYLFKEDDDYIPTYDEIVHDSDDGLSGDEKAIENQEEFEYKFNFRFEEPDQEFIKRYPRTIEKSLRRTDDKRKIKRADIKLRKQKEKEEKMSELKKLQELKRDIIEEKIEKIRTVTGDIGIELKDGDIEGDFDPDAHDEIMRQLFSEEFYQKVEDDQKPEFPDLDEELEIEKWDDWEKDESNKDSSTDLVHTNSINNLHCEDESFLMDADHHSTADKSSKEKTKRNKKGKRKSKVAEALEAPKPIYDPNDKNCEKYFDEYYKLDCEDIIEDIQCRFKYREVIPNDFGLSAEEILLAKDRELNRWCSLKKAVQYRPEHVEKYEQHAYSQKGKNILLKKKILPSLFEEADHKDENKTHAKTTLKLAQKQEQVYMPNEKKKLLASVKTNPLSNRKRKRAKKHENTSAEDVSEILTSSEQPLHDFKAESGAKEKKNKNIKSQIEQHEVHKRPNEKRKIYESDENYLVLNGKKAKKDKVTFADDANKTVTSSQELLNNSKAEKRVKKKKTKKIELLSQSNKIQSESNKGDVREINKMKKSKGKSNIEINKRTLANRSTKRLTIMKYKNIDNQTKGKFVDLEISNERLAAYGLNPKKFRNKLKYGKPKMVS